MSGSPDRATPNLTALVLTTRTLDAFLTTLAESAVALAPGCDGCGITLERQGHPLTVASSGATARRLDEKQYGQNDGPCLQALRTGQEVAVRDMRDETRWGQYPAYATASGTRSSLSLPIASRTHTAGAVNLYAPAPDGFAHTDLTVLRSLAAQATGAIALAQRLTELPVFTPALHTALTDRAVIDRAVGITMGRHHHSYERAMALLEDTARRDRTTLRELCAALVRSYDQPPGPGPTPAPDPDGPPPGNDPQSGR
jgi:GAF domain-containing protein